MTDCQACPSRNLCTKAKRRSLTLRHQAKHDSLVQQRAWQETPEFRQIATKRAGIEGTISQGVRAYGLRHARYRGLPKTRLQHLATGSAINLQRVADWLTGKQPEQTRQAPFTHLYGTSA